MAKPPSAVPASTPGCACSKCRKQQERQAKGSAGFMENAGRVQHRAKEKGWSDGDSEIPSDGVHFGHLTSAEMADRHEREAYGRPLTAAYRYLLGPTPECPAGDRVTAGRFLRRILAAIEVGNWTKSEWRRLYKMRDKWKARSTGENHRFNEVGNRRGGLDKSETANITQREIIAEMERELTKWRVGQQ